jgi:hypothetical protein
MIAKVIHQYTFDSVIQDPSGILWAIKRVPNNIQNEYKKAPNIIQYDDKIYHKMSYNSDGKIIMYKENNKAYHLRYSA